jgi:Family of unknown function (DUF5313)
VLHDVTTKTWLLRHITRSIVQFVPFAIVLFLVIPVGRVILGVGLTMGALIGVLFSTTFVDNVAESRAMKAATRRATPPRYAIVGRRTHSIGRDVRKTFGFSRTDRAAHVPAPQPWVSIVRPSDPRDRSATR